MALGIHPARPNALAFKTVNVLTPSGPEYSGEASVGSVPSVVNRTTAPLVALVIVTACAVEYVPVPGAIDGTSGPSVYAAVTIALGVAFTTQCPYCLDVHTRGAKRAGATREEIVEVSMLAAALRAGAAVTHGALALKLFDRA